MVKCGIFGGVAFVWIFVYAFGQEAGEWVDCTGEAVIQNITPEEAQVLARRRARLDAIEKVCGVSLQAESLVRDFLLAGDFIHYISSGRVVEEKDVSWEHETLPPKQSGSPPLMLMRIRMKARVARDTGEPDPSFKVGLTLNRSAYDAGDEVIVTVRATQDCYLTVFNLGADDSVRMLFPNPWQPGGFVEKNSSVEIPDKASRESGFRIRVATLPDHPQDTEIVKAVATKQPIPYIEDVREEEWMTSMGTPRSAMMTLARWLSEIPVSERAEAAAMYTVHAKE